MYISLGTHALFTAILFTAIQGRKQSNTKLEPWASKPARHYFEGLDMQRNE